MSLVTHQFPVLETERLTLRPPQMSDFDACADFLASPRSVAIGAGTATRTDAWKVFARIAGMWMLRGFGLFILEEKTTGKVLGGIGPWYPITWPEKELGWSIWAADAEGKGYAYEAASAARDHAFSTLGWDTAVSYIDADNARSIALAERLGAVRDPDAQLPDFPAEPENFECLAYRHPRPEALQ